MKITCKNFTIFENFTNPLILTLRQAQDEGTESWAAFTPEERSVSKGQGERVCKLYKIILFKKLTKAAHGQTDNIS